MAPHIPLITTLAIVAAVLLAPESSDANSLPPLIDFQSVLLDEGGNLLPSGATSVQFQILDENRAPIYTEVQSVDVVRGAASALIGNGADAKGLPTGGIPDDIFATGAPRYLQVQVAGHTPEDPMTIVPVPYAQWSQTCASVAEGSIKPASIAKAAVGFESLAPDVVAKLAEQLSQTQGMMTAQALNASGGAAQIGLQTKLINSGSTTVQGALQDIDLSVKKRQEETAFLTGKLNEEVTNRTNAVNIVQGNLDKEIKDRSTSITQEQQARTGSDNALQGQITKEISDRTTSDSSLQTQISTTSSTVTSQIGGITTTISDINNIPGILSKSKMEAAPALSPVPPIIAGELAYADFKFRYSGGSNQIQEGIKFIPFGTEVLAQNTCSDSSGHGCNFSELPADDTLYYCKVGIKITINGHADPGLLSGLNATCEYSSIANRSSVYDGDGGNLDYAVQKGILIHLYSLSGGNYVPGVMVLYKLYQIPISSQ